MKSSARKRIALCIGLLIVGGFGGYLLAKHQYRDPSTDAIKQHRPGIHSIFEESMKEFKHREQEMNDMFNDLENSFFEELDNTNITTGENTQSQGAFQYYQKTNNNGEESSYEVNGNWNEGENTGTMIIKGINNDGKEFSYTGTMENGESKGTLIDEDGNSKPVDFKNININDIYENSNHINN